MDRVQLAGLYFLGTEEYNSSNNMMATVVLKEKIDYEKLFPSYRALIKANPLLQTKIIEQPGENKFYWGRFSFEEIDGFLSFEQEQLSKKNDMETILKQYYPTNTRIPFYITVVDDYTVVVCMNHIIANGRSFIFWIQKWLQYYAGDKQENMVETTNTAFRHKSLHMLKRISAFLWVPVFLADFMLKVGKNTAKDTVDLSYGRRPNQNENYAIKSYSFSREDTQKILQRCKTKKMTLTEYMCGIFANDLLQYDHSKNRVLISIPMDMQSLLPYSPENTYGNLIGNLPAQFFRGREIEKQVKSVFKWFKRGLPYSLTCLSAAACRSYEKTKMQYLDLNKKPMPERFPLGDFSLTYSNLGVISYPVMEKLVDSIYFYFKPQTILVASSTLSGKLYVEVSLTKDLYNAEKVFNLFDQVLSVENLSR
jgi:NRPS condensation-like uncharacterized protein